MQIHRYLRAALTDPTAAMNRTLFGNRGMIERQIARVMRVDQHIVHTTHDELTSAEEFRQHINRSLSEGARQMYIGQQTSAEWLYVITRILRPTIAVETGVAAGLSSAYILLGLSENHGGLLYSIDLPNYEQVYLPKMGMEPVSILLDGKEPGFVIPEKLKTRWHLLLGWSQKILPELLKGLGSINLFFHDSEHTYDAMSFEYKMAWRYLGNSGLLISDDVGWNTAFRDFANCVRHRPVFIWTTGLGAIKKAQKANVRETRIHLRLN